MKEIFHLYLFTCHVKRIIYFAFLFYCLFIFQPLLGQDTSSIKPIDPVTVTAYKTEPVEVTSLNLILLSVDSLQKLGGFSINDLMAKTPGVSMLSTGVAIAKPVIRGAYGNRILILISGLKFDNQQWQDEHGLGINGIGLGRIELIKGPMSVLYGTEAMGGIVNLIEEDKAAQGFKESDVSIKFNSNTGGGLIQAGVRQNKGKTWSRLRIGAENHADYTDGNGNRILNSRFDGYYLKASAGFEGKNFSSANHFSSSFNRFGFIFNDIYTFITPDSRWSRNLNTNPNHLVFLNTLSSENRFDLKKGSKLNINAGIQSNQRMENEGSGAISLNMHLLTFQYLIRWELALGKNSKLVLSHLASIENNTNYGARKIVPDAWMQESNVSGYIEHRIGEHCVLENGIGVGQKWIRTQFTPSVNGPDKEIKPFSKFSPYYNVFTGISLFKEKRINGKFNAATGVRIPNLAELSSDGLHEGVFTYEIGDPYLKNEQNLSFNFVLSSSHKFIDFYLTPFLNAYKNYVYLAPTTENWFGFPVYRYQQQNVNQYGAEAAINVRPIQNLQLGSAISGMQSKTQFGAYTPFLPATKISTSIQFKLGGTHKHSWSAMVSSDYWMKQNRIFVNEIATPAYNLFNFGISGEMKRGTTQYQWSIAGNNVLNKAYYDHLSRFKYYGLNNIGRNISFQLKINFISPQSKK